MTVVVGTAGHIDHGKTALLRALTGIDADRLPEEQARGMTIDVGYAHLALPDGEVLDLVDVPGHDRLVGNMLVGAGEIDAVLLVVAADDGPRAQTLEHLELVDALGLSIGAAAVTKADLLPDDDPRRAAVVVEVATLLERTTLAGAPVVVVSAVTGEGLDALRSVLIDVRDRVALARAAHGAPAGARLAVDRVFTVRGRGAVATGSLRGRTVEPGQALRIEPGGGEVRVRGIQARGQALERADGGRTALNLAGIEARDLRRGLVLTDDPAIVATDRVLVAIRPATPLLVRTPRARAAPFPPVGTELRLHVGTDQAGATILRGARSAEAFPWGETVARLRLDRSVALAPGDRFVLRRPSPGQAVAGGRVLDPRPPAGISRRRASDERLAALAVAAEGPSRALALLDLHGAMARESWLALGGPDRGAATPAVGPLVLAPDVLDGLVRATLATVGDHHDSQPASAGIANGALRTAVALDLRRRVTIPPPLASGAASALLEGLVEAGRLARDGDVIRDPAREAGPPPALAAAMGRLEAMLDVPAPPVFSAAVAASGCPPEGVRRLERSGRIVRLDVELAWAATAYRSLATRAVELARAGPLTPAALRDATGTSRRYVMAVLEDLDRRGVLRRTADGHIPGPRPGALPGQPPGRPG